MSAAAQHEFDELMRDKDRRRGHPNDDHDSDDARSFLNLSDEDEDDDTTPAGSTIDADDDAFARPSSTLARSTIPLTRYGANTGPKGVISDAQNFRDSRRMHRMSRSNVPSQQQSGGRDSPAPTTLPEKVSESDEDDIVGEDDHDFMRKWRRSRLKELQHGTRESKLHNRERSKRLWGGLTTVDGIGYLDAVEESPADTVVLVYIYDDYSHVSTSIEDCIRPLAQKHLDVRFIKLHFQDAEMEPAGVPAILAYRGGDKFADLIPVIQEIPDDADLSSRTLEAVLRRHQILR